MTDLEAFQNNLGIKFTNQELLSRVFIHRSYLNEHPESKEEHNERLEFLGDAVLELVVTEHLYKNFNKSEGELTNLRSALVNGERLASLARKYNFGKYIRLSKGEEQNGGRDKQVILANALEAFIGALYLDKGLKTAKEFINKNILVILDEVLKNKEYIDPKSHFQEIVQEELGVTPHYKVLKESGPDHERIFTVGAFIKDYKAGEGEGSSKQKAQTEAAKKALATKTKWLPLLKESPKSLKVEAQR